MPGDLALELERLQLQFDEKAEGICQYRAELLAEAEGVKMEAQRLALMQKRLENKADRLKEYLASQLAILGIDKLKAGTFTLSLCKNSQPSVELALNSAIPEVYKRVTVDLDKKQVAADYKDGVALPPSIIVKQGFHLRVR